MTTPTVGDTVCWYVNGWRYGVVQSIGPKWARVRRMNTNHKLAVDTLRPAREYAPNPDGGPAIELATGLPIQHARRNRR